MIHKSQVFRGAAALLCALLVGCGPKLTYERWQTVRKGMSRAQVEKTLGQPWQTTAQAWVYYDQPREVAVMVWYDNGKVIGTTWQSPEHGLQGERPLPAILEQDADAVPADAPF